MKEEGSKESLHSETKIDLSAYISFCIWDIVYNPDQYKFKSKKWA